MTKHAELYAALARQPGAIEDALDLIGRDKLIGLLRQAGGAPGMFQASNDALRSAVRTYLLSGRLTGADVFSAAFDGQHGGKP